MTTGRVYGAAYTNPQDSLIRLRLLGYTPSFWGFSHSTANAFVCLSVGSARAAFNSKPDALIIVHDEFLNCYSLTESFVDGVVVFLKDGGLPHLNPQSNWSVLDAPAKLGTKLDFRKRLLNDYAENSFFAPLQSTIYKLPKDIQIPIKNAVIRGLMDGYSRDKMSSVLEHTVRNGRLDCDTKVKRVLTNLIDFVYSGKHNMVVALPEVRSHYVSGIGEDDELFEAVPWKELEERHAVDSFELRYSMKTFCRILAGIKDSGVDVQFFEGQARRRAGQNE